MAYFEGLGGIQNHGRETLSQERQVDEARHRGQLDGNISRDENGFNTHKRQTDRERKGERQKGEEGQRVLNFRSDLDKNTKY